MEEVFPAPEAPCNKTDGGWSLIGDCAGGVVDTWFDTGFGVGAIGGRVVGRTIVTMRGVQVVAAEAGGGVLGEDLFFASHGVSSSNCEGP